MTKTKPKFPEHEKLKKVQEISQQIGFFLDSLSEMDLALCDEPGSKRGGRESYFPTMRPITEILADYFEIDLKKLDNEKRSMLKQLRALDKKES
jgi:hypothetical protein